MAEQTYDLTQTGAEVQAIINDANNVKGAGAQTTLTTEFVLLKDTDGQYHKILKSSFTEAIRDTFAGLLVNNDKGTTINQIAAIASGDFGSVTPANLASVLGVERVSTTVASGGSITIPARVGILMTSTGSDTRTTIFLVNKNGSIAQVLNSNPSELITHDDSTARFLNLVSGNPITVQNNHSAILGFECKWLSF